VVTAGRVHSKLLDLTEGIMAEFSPFDLASSDKNLSFLASNPLFHVRMLTNTSVLVSVVSNDSEQPLESFTHSDNETAFFVTEPLFDILVNF
jgi:hypothetical protein